MKLGLKGMQSNVVKFVREESLADYIMGLTER